LADALLTALSSLPSSRQPPGAFVRQVDRRSARHMTRGSCRRPPYPRRQKIGVPSHDYDRALIFRHCTFYPLRFAQPRSPSRAAIERPVSLPSAKGEQDEDPGELAASARGTRSTSTHREGYARMARSRAPRLRLYREAELSRGPLVGELDSPGTRLRHLVLV